MKGAVGYPPSVTADARPWSGWVARSGSDVPPGGVAGAWNGGALASAERAVLNPPLAKGGFGGVDAAQQPEEPACIPPS
jgi:hypothetical protein